MKIKRAELVKTLGILYKAVPIKSVNNYSQTFLFTCKDTYVLIRAGEGQMNIIAELTLEDNSKEEFSIPAKTLLDAVKSIEGDIIEFVADKNCVSVNYPNGNFSLPNMGNDFPPVDIPEEDGKTVLQIAGDKFAQGLQTVHFAVSDDELRPALLCILLKVSEGKAAMVATDTRVLVKYNAGASATDGQLLLPERITKLLKMLPVQDSLSFEIGKKTFLVRVENFQMTHPVPDGKFPAFESVIPQQTESEMIIESSVLAGAINRVSTCAAKERMIVKFVLENTLGMGQLTVSAKTIDADGKESKFKATETAPCEYFGERLEVFFKAESVSAALDNLNVEKIKMGFQGSKRAALITDVDDPEAFKCIIMPTYGY